MRARGVNIYIYINDTNLLTHCCACARARGNNNNNNKNYDKDFASFATRRFTTLTTIYGHLEDVGSYKNTRYE